MTDRPAPQHPDLETLSEWLDDPDAASDAELAHVDRCELCQGRLGELRWARDSVAQPVPHLAAGQRDRAIADALAAMADWDTAPAARTAPADPAPGPQPGEPVQRPAAVAPLAPGRSRSRLWWAGSSAAAAVLVVVLATVALLGRGSNARHDTALSSAPSESGKAALSSGGAASDAGTGDSAVSGGDLGDVPNIEVLRSRVAGAARGQSSVGASAGPAPAPAAPVPNVVGTRVCEAEARTAQPRLGVVVYAANLRFQGTTAVVLGFAPTPGVPPATLLVLAPQEGCRLLAEAAPS